MGWTSNRQLIVPLLLYILQRESDEEHPMTLDMLCDKLLEYYESDCLRDSLKATISRNIRTLEELLDTLRVCDYGIYPEKHEKYVISPGYLELAQKKYDDTMNPMSRAKAYYFANRYLSNTEIDLICDSIWCAKGIGYDVAKKLVDKISLLGGHRYKGGYSSVNYSVHMPRTDCEDMGEILYTIGMAIVSKKKIKLKYNKKDKCIYLSPYGILASWGKYYLICHKKGQEFSWYRIDRMSEVGVTDQDAYPLEQIDDPLATNFSAERFATYYPRMMIGNRIELVLKVKPNKLESVLEEFEPVSEPFLFDDIYRVRVNTTDCHAANWLINFDDSVMLDEEYISAKDVIDIMVERCTCILRRYRPELLADVERG